MKPTDEDPYESLAYGNIRNAAKSALGNAGVRGGAALLRIAARNEARQWLVSDGCRLYCGGLGVDHDIIMAWAQAGFPDNETAMRSVYHGEIIDYKTIREKYMSIESMAREIQDIWDAEFIRRLLYYRNNEEAARWYTGDLAVDLVDELLKDYPVTAIRLAMAREYGCSEGTIRDRERVSRHVPQSERADNPNITHRMWREIISGDVDELLSQIYAHAEAYGEYPTIAQIREWRDDAGGTVVHVWVQRVESLQAPLEKIIYDDMVPEELRKFLAQALAMLMGYVQRFRGQS